MNGNWKKQVKAKVTIERGWGEGAGGGELEKLGCVTIKLT